MQYVHMYKQKYISEQNTSNCRFDVLYTVKGSEVNLYHTKSSRVLYNCTLVYQPEAVLRGGQGARSPVRTCPPPMKLVAR